MTRNYISKTFLRTSILASFALNYASANEDYSARTDAHQELHAQLKQSTMVPESISLLKYLALLPANNIPKKLLIDLVEGDSDLEYSLSLLGSLVQIKETTVNVDPIVQAIIAEEYVSQQPTLLATIASLTKGYDYYLMSDPNKALPIYLQELVAAKKSNILQNIADVNYKLSVVSFNLAKVSLNPNAFTDALDFSNEALEIYMKIGSLTPGSNLDVLKCLIIKGRSLGYLDHPLMALNSLLTAYQQFPIVRDNADSGNYQIYKHLGWHFRLLSLRENSFKDLPEDALYLLIANLNTIDSDYPGMVPVVDEMLQENWVPDINTGDYEKTPISMALRCYQKGLAIDWNCFGLTSLNTAKSYGLLAWVFNEQKEYLEAVKYLQAAIQVKLLTGEAMQADLAESYIFLGNNLAAYGNFHDALVYYTKAFKINEQLFRRTDRVLVKNMDKIKDTLKKLAMTP